MVERPQSGWVEFSWQCWAAFVARNRKLRSLPLEEIELSYRQVSPESDIFACNRAVDVRENYTRSNSEITKVRLVGSNGGGLYSSKTDLLKKTKTKK